MKHTKNILKSLLITVMALSLLAVSCKKDEGGTKNPVNPTPITIKASDLTEALTAITIQGKINFVSVAPNNGKASVNAEINNYNELKTALDDYLTNNEQESVKVVAAYGVQNNTTFDLTLTITAKAGYVLDDKMTEYTYNTSDKTAQLIITITASSGNWQ